MHAIDHLVLPVTTLTLARSRLTSLGFTVAPDARHPFGTGNCCVLFEDRSFLEPITIQDRDAADKAAAEGLYFVKRIKRFTERQGEGFAMLALASDDVEVARRVFERARLSVGETFSFSRMATLPDGVEREIGFSLAFAETPATPDATIFACQHLAPDVLFQPQYLEHANSAAGIAAAVAVSEKPDDFRSLLEVSGGDVTGSSSSLEAKIGAQSIEFLTPEAFRERYDVPPPDPRRGLLFAGIDIGVLDLGRAAKCAGAAARRHRDRIVVPPAPGLSVVLAFQELGDG